MSGRRRTRAVFLVGELALFVVEVVVEILEKGLALLGELLVRLRR